LRWTGATLPHRQRLLGIRDLKKETIAFPNEIINCNVERIKFLFDMDAWMIVMKAGKYVPNIIITKQYFRILKRQMSTR